MQTSNCPKCGSEDIMVEGTGIKPDFDFNGSKVVALKFDSPANISQLTVQCNECNTELKPTTEGYRIK